MNDEATGNDEAADPVEEPAAQPEAPTIEERHENRNLQVKLTAEELLAYGEDLALDVQRVESLTDERKQIGTKVKDLVIEIRRISEAIAHGEELRLVACTARTCVAEDWCVIVRDDTAEVIDTRKLMPDEKQLELPFSEEPEQTDENSPLPPFAGPDKCDGCQKERDDEEPLVQIEDGGVWLCAACREEIEAGKHDDAVNPPRACEGCHWEVEDAGGLAYHEDGRGWLCRTCAAGATVDPPAVEEAGE